MEDSIEDLLKAKIGPTLFQSVINYALDYAILEAKEYLHVEQRGNPFIVLCQARRGDFIRRVYDAVLNSNGTLEGITFLEPDQLREVLNELYNPIRSVT